MRVTEKLSFFWRNSSLILLTISSMMPARSARYLVSTSLILFCLSFLEADLPLDLTCSSSRWTRTSMTMPFVPPGTTRDEFLTSDDFSPKMAFSRRSSGARSGSFFGVILPTRMSPGLTSAPMRMTPSVSRLRRASSPSFGMSRVISSLPSLVSRAWTSSSVMWTLE